MDARGQQPPGRLATLPTNKMPYPTTLADNRTTIRVRSTTTSLQVSGTTTSGHGWHAQLNGFELSVAPPGVDGDYNGNGTVDAADYVVWRKNVGNLRITLPHDPTRSGSSARSNIIPGEPISASPRAAVDGIDGSDVPEPAFAPLLITIGAVLDSGEVGRVIAKRAIN